MTLRDAGDRTRAVTETGSSFLVEASAGTGKTTTLIARICTLVLEKDVPLGRVAAMTFTEKAAGEMKTKLRQELEKEAATGRHDSRETNARRALFELEAAEISTIHSFCARLLRERPVESAVDPDFVAGDELLAADLAGEAFDTWFDREARRGEGPVAATLLAGADPEGIRELATDLYAARLVLDRATLPRDATREARELLGSLVSTYEPLVPLLSSKKDEKKRERVSEVLEALRARNELPDERLAGDLPDLKIDLRGTWPPEVKAAIESSRTGLGLLGRLLPALPVVPVLEALLEEIRRSFFPEIEAAKRQRGLLDFDDLLLRARDLLRDSPAAREHFYARFDALVVDEFQDTDPVQAEIVMRLAAPPAAQGNDWTELSPEPGRLFLVGDPKQSIYRFRRADVESYADARRRVGTILPLTTNFRSSVPLIDFVNAVGPALLPEQGDESPWMVPYAPLSPGPSAPASPSPGVLFLAPPPPEPANGTRRAGEEDDEEDEAQLKVNEQEARAVANLLLSSHAADRERYRWDRIAVLVPRHSAIEFLQHAFREAGIPFVLEGGKSFYKREETAAAVAALSAIDDPGDAVSVAAALKSVLFGASDVELLDAAESGSKFDDLSSFPPNSPLRRAADVLLRLHAGRHRRPLAETLADLLASTQALAAAENGAVVNPLQAVANLERLLVLARELDREGLSFRDAVARLRRRTAEDGPEPAARADEADAVRLLTLHKAKGLEFPVVVLADLGLKEQRRRTRRARVVCERAGGRYGVRLLFGGIRVGTARLTEVEAGDEERQEGETRRLLYVGLTRAKERLVVSWFRKRTLKKEGDLSDSLAKSFLNPLARFEDPSGPLAALVEIIPADLSASKPPPEAPEPASTVDLAAAMAAAEARLERARATASRPLRRAGEKESVLALTHEDVEPADREDPPDRARRIGVAVHAAMEALLARTTPPDAAAAADAVASAAEGLFEDERREVSNLVEELLSNPVVAHAFAATRRFVEMPLLYVDDSLPDRPLVEGKIDLLFEEADGWQVVDWKTDRVDTPADRLARQEFHAPQIRAYEQGLRKLLGPAAVVKDGLVIFARQTPPSSRA